MATRGTAAWLLASALCVACARSPTTSPASLDGGAGAVDDGGATGASAGFDPSLAAALQAALDDQVRTQPLLGATLAVAIANHGRWIGASGFRDAARTDPILPADRFRVGSITKTFTGAVILQLVEAGVVRLDDPLERWVPGFPNGNQITIRELLNHTSGVYDFLADATFDRAARHRHTDMVDVAASHSAAFTAPGAAFSYSNTNFILLGLVIEAATKRPYAASVAARLLAPAALADTFVDDDPPDPSALPYVRGFARQGGQWVDVTAGDSASVAWSAGAVVANAQDLVSWLAALASARVVSAASWTEMTTPTTLGGQAQPYGLAMMIDLRQPSHAKLGHDGAISGYESDVRIDPARGITISALTNTDGGDATRLADAAWAIVDP